MKRITRLLKIEPATITLVLGFSIGLALTVHEAFFVLVLIGVLVVAAEWTMEKMRELLCHRHLRSMASMVKN